jgi:Protein of unknown function (DUF4012)
MKKYFKNLEKTLLTTTIVLVIVGGALWIERNYLSLDMDDAKDSPIEKSGPMAVFTEMTKHILFSSEEKVFLVLFQNNMELRTGGGFIGSFGIIKTKNKKIVDFSIHDTANFDGRIPSTVKTPYPMGEMLHIDSWKLRDSNYSPNFLTNAKKAEDFYNLGGGEEGFDGIIAVNASVLESILGVLGPITIEGIGEFNEQDALISLEKQVEIDYKEQGIEKGDRKKIMNDFLRVVIKEMEKLSLAKKLQLVKVFIKELDEKSIQLYFDNKKLQESVENVGWAGEVNQLWRNDYLMVVDANLGAYKSDYYMEREIEYFIDLSQEKPVVKLKITHNHTAEKKDWMTNDYQGYMKVYVPENAWLSEGEELKDVQFGKEFGKKYFGKKIFIPVGSSDSIEFEYYLSREGEIDKYDFLFQKQSGVKNLLLNITVKYPDGTEKKVEETITKDFVLSENL